MEIRKRGGCDEKEGSGRQIPMSINMPQLYLVGSPWGKGDFCLGGGGGDPRLPTPLYETLKVILGTNGKHPGACLGGFLWFPETSQLKKNFLIMHT